MISRSDFNTALIIGGVFCRRGVRISALVNHITYPLEGKIGSLSFPDIFLSVSKQTGMS